MIVVNELTTIVKNNKDILHYYLTDWKTYEDILKSDEYQVSKYIGNFLRNDFDFAKKTYLQKRVELIQKFKKYCQEEKERERVARCQQDIEKLKKSIVSDNQEYFGIYALTDKIVPEIPVDILDIFLLDPNLYRKMVQSEIILINEDIVDFLRTFQKDCKFYGQKRQYYIEAYSKFLVKKKAEIIISNADMEVPIKIDSLTDKLDIDSDIDILDVFLSDRKTYKHIRKSKKFVIAPMIKDFLQKYVNSNIKEKSRYIENFEEYMVINNGQVGAVCKIVNLTDMISIENKDILTLFLEDNLAYQRICKKKHYQIDKILRKFLESYKPKIKSYSKKQKQEYIEAFTEYKKSKNEQRLDYQLLEELLNSTRNGSVHWKKRKWKKTSQFLEQDFVTQYGKMECVFSIIGRSVEAQKWKVHMSLEMDGKNNVTSNNHKLYELLYQEILKSIKTAETKEYKQKVKQLQANTRHISSDDFVVRTNIFRCVFEHHHLEEILGIIHIVKPDGTTMEEKVTAAYCQECDCYFLMRSEYERVAKKGILLCHMIEKEEFYKHGLNLSHLAGESILMQNGYNVKANVGLTDIQRQTILANIIDNHILTASQIISYLQMFMAQKKGLPSYRMAVGKWDADLQFVRLYKEDAKRRVFISSITKTAYRKV